MHNVEGSDTFANRLHSQNPHLVLIAVLIGVAAGVGNIIFRTVIAWIQRISYGTELEVVLPALQNAPIYRIILIPALGGLLVGLIYQFYKTPEGRGVSMVMKALAFKTNLPPLTAAVTTLTSAITIGTGGSAGREGPIVQIGAAIGSGIGKLFRFSPDRMRFAVASGAGGGLAATFNTPMAGAMFTAEVLLGRLELQVFAPVIVSCVSATVVSRAWFGSHITFAAPNYAFTSFFEIPAYAVLGLVTGLAGALFIKFYYLTESTFKQMKIPTWLKPALGGLLVGLIGIFCRNIMGGGYGTISQILDGGIVGYFLLLLVGLKIVATSLTLGSGGSGGLFVPSLFVGAALGGFFGWGAHLLLPQYFSTSGSYALVGMGAMLAATMRAPITSILMIFEITQSYQIVLPLMTAVIVANVFATLAEKDSFFTHPLSQEGVDLRYNAESAILEHIRVRYVMTTKVVKFYENTPFFEVTEAIRKNRHNYFPVVTNNDELIGMMSLKDVNDALVKKGFDNNLVARDMCEECAREDLIFITPDNSLAEATLLFKAHEAGALPVLDKHNKLVGILRKSDILFTLAAGEKAMESKI
ncbi:MAG: chloride channel protein [Deferribacteraceae bacterium]|jgi:CIC family chloride channel protein|nr:chloride channel protein [Deferribacteraceae bacterium]